MNIEKIKSSLQDLIYRLQDAEKGYREIRMTSSNDSFNSWLDLYAEERRKMAESLEAEMKKLGGNPVVTDTFLGEMHRILINLKLNLTSSENEFPVIVDEIERGASTLIDDYQKILSDVEMPPQLVTILMDQKLLVKNELGTLTSLRDKLNKVEA
ncbi:MAG: PA2169 family four-helix-bundle protein [Saprospiraceae bacterium]|nr:PA2169 family four-helix-bundle protein [Bacteroidia bacterium]NNE14607.1 PA2169 family four-helix-bundle protein [Saprospiraceae bacterium]NNL92510.1 PA2169 family four-helix-bundle protein [Saprospiraceae bacterium]